MTKTKENPLSEKLLRFGAHTLQDKELLALLLTRGSPSASSLKSAEKTLLQFGNFRQLLSINSNEKINSQLMNNNECACLQAAYELSKRSLNEKLVRPTLFTNSYQTQQFIELQLRDFTEEVFACAFLDNQHRLITFEKLFQGTISNTSIYPRILVRKCMQYQAASIVLAHNHPSGTVTPSTADRNVTNELQKILELIDVQVLDHIIVGDEEAYSFAEHGEIAPT